MQTKSSIRIEYFLKNVEYFNKLKATAIVNIARNQIKTTSNVDQLNDRRKFISRLIIRKSAVYYDKEAMANLSARLN